MIDSKEISVIVQGAVDKKITPKTLKSVRKYLPNAEIILSTWEGTDISGLDYDIVLLSKDPGAYIFDWESKKLNNINRQLVSIQYGLKSASKKYVLKLRSDCILSNANFLFYFDKFNQVNPDFKIFQHKILVCSICSREYAHTNGLPLPFHVSDFWLFGLTEDIRNYFVETPLMTKEQSSDWHYKCPDRVPNHHLFWAYPPEQYYCVSWVKRNFKNIQFDDWSEWNSELFELSQNIIYNNFVFLDYDQSGIFSAKYKKLFIKRNQSGVIYYDTFIKRYMERFDIDDSDKKTYLKQIKLYQLIAKFYEHYQRFVFPIKKTINWCFEPFSIMHYTIKILFGKIKL